MLGGILYWMVAGLAVTVVSLPLRLLISRESGTRFGRRLLHYLFRGFVAYLRATDLVRADLSALARLAVGRDAVIIAPNHASLWDAVFLIARLPRAVCVMKKSILRNPILGGGARLAGYIPGAAATTLIRDSVNALGTGGQLLLFPEGTRTHPDARWINRIKGGCSLIASRSGARVQPVFIRSSSRFLQKGWPLWRVPAFPILVRIEVGEPLIILKGESPQSFTARLQAVFDHELAKPDPLRRQSTTSAR